MNICCCQLLLQTLQDLTDALIQDIPINIIKKHQEERSHIVGCVYRCTRTTFSQVGCVCLTFHFCYDFESNPHWIDDFCFHWPCYIISLQSWGYGSVMSVSECSLSPLLNGSDVYLIIYIVSYILYTRKQSSIGISLENMTASMLNVLFYNRNVKKYCTFTWIVLFYSSLNLFSFLGVFLLIFHLLFVLPRPQF